MAKKDASSVYLYFREYSNEEIDQALEKLSKEELDLLHRRYGEDLRHAVINSTMSTKDKQRIRQSVFSRLEKLLKGETVKSPVTKNHIRNIYTYFSEYDEKEIDAAIKKLPKEELDLLHKRFGEDLKHPQINRKMDHKDIIKINGTILKHIQGFIEKKPVKVRTRIDNLYDYFSEYDEKEIDAAIKKLPKEELDLLHKRFGEDLKKPKVNRKMDIKEVTKIRQTIIVHLRILIEEKPEKIRTRINNLYDYFSEYNEEEIDAAIKKLPKEELDLLHKRFGEDLKNPRVNRKMDSKEVLKIRQTIIKHIQKALPRKSVRSLTVENQQLIGYPINVKNESIVKVEKSPTPVQSLGLIPEYEELKIKEFSKDDYIQILELFHHPIFEDLVKEEMSIEELMIFSLKIGFYQGKYFTTDSVSKFFGVDPDMILRVQKSGLELFRGKVDQMIEEELSRNPSNAQDQKIRRLS